MQIDFHTAGFFYGDVAIEYAEHRIGFALGRFKNSVRRVEVTIEAFPASRLKTNKQCKMLVHFSGDADPICATAVEATLKAAIDAAASIASRSAKRRLNRRRGARRSSATIRAAS